MEKSADFIVSRVMKHNFELTVESMLQPIFDTSTVSCVGAEFLIRGIYRRTLITPHLFIKKLEDNGGIISLGEHIIGMAFEYMSTIIMPLNLTYSLHINLSPVQLNCTTFSRDVIALAEHYAVKPSRIVFEITGSNTLPDGIGLYNSQVLREAGFLLAWDDINNVAELEAKLNLMHCDFIKLDRSCFKASCLNEAKRLIEYAQAQEVDVIAEGVESFSQMKMLFNNNVKMAQGYLFSRPIDRDSFRKKHLLPSST